MPTENRWNQVVSPLRQLRRRTGLRVGQFAAVVGCSAAHLTSCENGHRDPGPELAEVIARELSRLLGQVIAVNDFLPTGKGSRDRPQPPNEPNAPPKRKNGNDDNRHPHDKPRPKKAVDLRSAS